MSKINGLVSTSQKIVNAVKYLSVKESCQRMTQFDKMHFIQQNWAGPALKQKFFQFGTVKVSIAIGIVTGE